MPKNRVRNNQPNTLLKTKDRLRTKLVERKGGIKLCLTMIVKNESKNMVRLLDSLKSIIDMISIVDTGSTDNTIDVIYNWAKENGPIDCKVHQEPFKNFCYNRTHSVLMAKKTFPEADYLLLSDADFVWNIDVGSKFNKNLLVDHKYLVEQYNKALKYWNIRLLSTKVDFECFGVTHEYWGESKTQHTYQGEIRCSRIHTLKIDDQEDGGCKEDKFDRDERLLRHEIENPTKENKDLLTRYKFYLAQTLKDKNNFLDSIEWYKKRVEDGGWQEEVYYSIYQIGRNYENLGKIMNFCKRKIKEPSEIIENEIEKYKQNILKELTTFDDFELKEKEYFDLAETYYSKAYNYRPTRLESLCCLVEMLRSKGECQKAYDYAIKGIKTPYPTTDTLFIEDACYKYKLQYELSIVCYYLPEQKNFGAEMIEYLLYTPNIPDNILHSAKSNAKFYI